MPRTMPTEKPSPETMPLSDAALELRRDYHRALKDMLEGTLSGRRNERGRWIVTVESVEREKARIAKQRRG
jgi:hypothetical protein